MQLPLTDPDPLFEELLQDLPPETVQMARAFKAFVRAKKVKTPGQLLRVVFLYCGLDKSWLCRKVGFWRQNPKIGSRQINHLQVSTFLFSVICDRALFS